MEIINKVRNFASSSNFVRFFTWIVVYNLVDLSAKFGRINKAGEKRKRVIFIRLDGIGDFVIWTATFSALDQIYPRDEFERIFIGSRSYQELADAAELFERTYYIDRRKFISNIFYRREKLLEIRALGAEIIVNPTISRDFLWADSIVRVTGSKEKIGSIGEAGRMTGLQKSISDAWYTRLLPFRSVENHSLITDLEFINNLSNVQFSLTPLPLPFDSIDANNGDSTSAVLFLGAQFAHKRWDVANFAEVGRVLQSQYGLNIIVAGGPNEKHLGDEFAQHFTSDFEVNIGYSFHEFCKTLANARILVTNDTSAGHLAAAMRCPTVVIRSGGYPGRFFPYPSEFDGQMAKQVCVSFQMPCFGCSENCIFTELAKDDPKPCLSNINVSDVLQGVEQILGV